MSSFFHETRKAWAAGVVALSTGWGAAATDGVVTGIEIGTFAIATVVAWVVTWAVPNRDTAGV